MSSSYNRSTELRKVHTKDLYNLAVILEDKWQTLMEVIPKVINNQTFGTAEDLEKISSGSVYERKYNDDHIRMIENAKRVPGGLCSLIFLDEWGTSGRKHERPTLGVLLHLLVQLQIYRAADFVAELLNEPKPPRPNNGIAAEIEFDVFDDIQEIVNDTRFYPNTEDLQENVKIHDINNDYFIKYQNVNKLPTIIDNNEETMISAPKPPPRLLKSARLLKQQQQQQLLSNQLLQQTASKSTMMNKNPNNEEQNQQQTLQELKTQSNNESISAFSSISTNNMPNLSALMQITNSEKLIPTNTITIPNCVEDDDQQEKHSDLSSIPIVIVSENLLDCKTKEELKPDNESELCELPAISALNLNGERDDIVAQKQHNIPQQSNNFQNVPSGALNFVDHRRDNFSECAAIDEDLNIPWSVANMNCNDNSSRHQLEAIEEDYNGIEHEHDIEVELDDDEDSVPNLSFLDNRSSNNESSLTSVTNTSGDNSFEQSVNDCSSTSTDNVPCLPIFKQ